MYYMQLEDERRRQHAAAQEAAWWGSLSQEERDSVVRERAEAEVARAHAVADRTKAEAAAERAMIDGRREAVRYLTEGITALRLADAPHAVRVRDRNAGGLRKTLMNAWLLA